MFNILRLFFAITTLSLVVVGIGFYNNHNCINDIDNYIVKRYTDRYANRLERAKSCLPKDKGKSIKVLKSLLDDLESIKVMDRLGPTKRNSFILLSRLLREEGQLDEALSYANLWVLFNERDLMALVLQGELLASVPERYEDGMRVLEGIFKKVPEAEFVVNAYAGMLRTEGRLTDAFLAFLKHINALRNVPNGAWHVYWDSGNGFNNKNNQKFVPAVGSDGLLILDFTLNSESKNLRIDPPPFSRLSILNPELSFVEDGEKSTTQLTELSLQFHQMSQVGGKLKTIGENDPYFRFVMPENKSKTELSVTFKAKINLLVPEKMRLLALSSEADLIESDLLVRKEIAAVNILEEIREEAEELLSLKMPPVIKSPIALYWTSGKEVFSEKKKSWVALNLQNERGVFLFDIVLSPRAVTDHLRIDFPDKPGVCYSLNQMDLIYGEQEIFVDISKIKILIQHNIERKRNQFKVTGADPHFSFLIPSKEKVLTSVHLIGSVK